MNRAHSGGFSFVELIVASAVMLLFFAGLIAGVKVMIELIGESKAETGARSLALSRMEYIRSLDYDAVGTEGGIPAGDILQTSTTTLNGIEYTERVLILYIDREEDGLEDDDENGVLEDSKRIKVEYSWESKGNTRSLSLVSDMAPKGLETSSGGGTLIVKVFDADVLPVSGATVRVINTSVATDTIDISLDTNSEGKAIIPGAPARGDYEVSVSKTDFSADATYSVTAENPNPNPPHVAVASSTISSVTFFIDELSDITIRSVGEPVVHDFTDDFSDASLLASQSNTTVSGGSLVLGDDGAGGYLSSGQAYSTTTAPSSFSAWQSIDWTASAPANTSLLVHLYSESGGAWSVVPETDLAGNEAGFVTGPIDISGLSTTTYGRLALGASLTTSDASSTPSVNDWQLTYIESEPPLPNITFDLAGTKTIGTGVLKYEEESTTDSGGTVVVPLEWDTYDISVDGATLGYDIKEVRGILPYLVNPGSDATLIFVMSTHADYTLHVTVTDSDGVAIPNANVNVTGTGYNETISTSIYGQAFFGDVPQSGSYSISITKSGYQTHNDTLSVTGNLMARVNLISS